MSFHQYYKIQIIDASIDEVWDFISSPANLKLITPDDMGFDITSSHAIGKMYQGMMVSYKVSPFSWFKTDWLTEITHVVEKKYFVDEQRVGPYSLWHHQHILDEVGGIVIMKDIITYQPPLGVLGTLANSLFIRKKLNQIFDYREQAIEKYFAKEKSTHMTLCS